MKSSANETTKRSCSLVGPDALAGAAYANAGTTIAKKANAVRNNRRDITDSFPPGPASPASPLPSSLWPRISTCAGPRRMQAECHEQDHANAAVSPTSRPVQWQASAYTFSCFPRHASLTGGMATITLIAAQL